MLWYKAWLETRARFLLCLLGTTAICGAFTIRTQAQAMPDTSPWYFASVNFYAHQYLAGMWLLSAVLLGMGGLVREGAAGTAAFSLALPVSRRAMAGVRIGCGAVQMVLMGVVPWMAIGGGTLVGGHPLEWDQVGRYLVLLLSGGFVYFSGSLLVSSLVEGEYTGPAVAMVIVIVSALVPGMVKSWRPFSVIGLISGGDLLDKQRYLLRDPFPWLPVGVSLVLTAALLWLSVRAVESREF